MIDADGKTLERELKPLESIRDHNPKYLLTMDLGPVVSHNGIKQMNVMILSQIGKPIDQPKAASTQVILEDGVKLEDVDKKVEQIVDRWLEDISIITENVVQGKTRTF